MLDYYGVYSRLLVFHLVFVLAISPLGSLLGFIGWLNLWLNFYVRWFFNVSDEENAWGDEEDGLGERLWIGLPVEDGSRPANLF